MDSGFFIFEEISVLLMEIMKGKLIYIIALTLFTWICPSLLAQIDSVPKSEGVRIDTTMHQILPAVTVYPTPEFKSKRMERQYWKLVRDVKKTLPYAKGISELVLSLEDTLQTFPDQRSKRKFLKSKEKELFADYEQPLKNLTFSQGRLLIKLVDRECSETSYELVQLYRGNLAAFFWQSVAVIFGMNLKNEYDEAGEDFIIEHVVFMVENGLI